MLKAGIIGSLCFMGAVIAQVAPETHAPSLPNFDLSNLTATGLLGFYALYVTTRTIPTIQANAREDIAKMQALHREDISKAWDKLDLLSNKVIESNMKLNDTLGDALSLLKDRSK